MTKWYMPHCIIRPSIRGQWAIQNDATHEATGFVGLTQHADRLQVHFSGNVNNPGPPPYQSYTVAGSVQVTTDDGICNSLSAHANLGLTSVTIYLRAYPATADMAPINPSDVWDYLPPDRKATLNGNLWISARMGIF